MSVKQILIHNLWLLLPAVIWSRKRLVSIFILSREPVPVTVLQRHFIHSCSPAFSFFSFYSLPSSPSNTHPLAVCYLAPPLVHFSASLLLPQPGPGKVPALGLGVPPAPLINLPTDCRGVARSSPTGCLQQLSDELTSIKTSVRHRATVQRLDCPCFVWHTRRYSSQS